MAEIIEWNNSALSTLQQCGEKFRRRYIEKEYRPPSPRQVRGTVVHRVASKTYLRKMRADGFTTAEEARDLAASEFDLAWRSGVELNQDEAAEGVATIEGRAKDFAVDLSEFHAIEVAPAINPIGVERKIIVKPKGSDLVIHGTMDLIDKLPNGEAIRDLKTAERSPNKAAADESQQLTMYAMIRTAEVGTLPVSLALDYLVRTPQRAEKKHVPLSTTRTMEDIHSLVNRINVAVEAVKRGAFIPANQDSWFCSPLYCEFFRDCPYTVKGKTRSGA